ncbi:MAG: SPOR domain-containing protein [Rikenellaceae bacterium]|nr:SPOR domain-containing protein [Rikenellaceae bacterium]
MLWVIGWGCVTTGMAQTVRARVSGLEADSAYMSLLREEAMLKIREDSLESVIRARRQQLSGDTTDLFNRSQQILRLEEQLFDLRSRQGNLASGINSIEQEFILNHLSGSGLPGVSSGSPSSNYPNLIDNDFFRQNLDDHEYRQLTRAQQAKFGYAPLIDAYRIGYQALQELAAAYEESGTPGEADSLYEQYRQQVWQLKELENRIITPFQDGYGHEVYLYSLLLDKLNRMNDLAALNQQARNRPSYSPSEVMSVGLAEMPGQYALALEYEKTLAQALNLSAALDSLQRVERTLRDFDLAFPNIELTEKEFVNYQEISFPGTAVYTNDHPIPELVIPESGTYYSVTVGSFSQRQPVSVFRGAVPIGYQRTGGQWRYFAGLFRSYGDALEAVQQLKEAGFRRPEAVRWYDGNYENLAAKAAQNMGLWRIVIQETGTELAPEARFALNRYAASKEITRIGDLFYVGTFTDRLHVEEVWQALEKICGLEIRVEEME